MIPPKISLCLNRTNSSKLFFLLNKSIPAGFPRIKHVPSERHKKKNKKKNDSHQGKKEDGAQKPAGTFVHRSRISSFQRGDAGRLKSRRPAAGKKYEPSCFKACLRAEIKRSYLLLRGSSGEPWPTSTPYLDTHFNNIINPAIQRAPPTPDPFPPTRPPPSARFHPNFILA